MAQERIVKRYTSYYEGWCVAFGEHDIAPEQGAEVAWIFGEGKVGMTLSARLRKVFVRELLQDPDADARLSISGSRLSVNDFEYSVGDEAEQASFDRFRAFFDEPGDVHMFLTSHFCYPQGTRIVTFDRKKPLIIIYKEIAPLYVRLD